MTHFGSFSTKSAIQHSARNFLHSMWEKAWLAALICGGLDQIRGEQLIYMLGMDLSFMGWVMGIIPVNPPSYRGDF